MVTQNANTDEGGNVPQPVIEDLLADETRRQALEILRTREGPVVVEDLAAAVVGTRKDCPTSAVSATDREAVAEELFTEHIPKLTATGVVTYDSLLGAVELRRRDLAP
jgi:hypothetical protein